MDYIDDRASEVENVAIALHNVATQIKRLGNGDASTGFGAIECIAMKIDDGAKAIADAINNLADAVRQHGEL